jgi:hypothetical protein
MAPTKTEYPSSGKFDKLQQEDIASIVEKEMPGWKLASKPIKDAMPTQDNAKPASTLPSIDDLKKRYKVTDVVPSVAVDAIGSDSTTTVVTVESGELKKTIGIQGRKIKWSQG